MTKNEQEKLDAAKAEANVAAGEKKTVTPDTITFKKGSDSGIVYSVLEKARKALTLKEIKERAEAKSIKNPGRAQLVANWFVTNNIAAKDEKGCISLIAKTPPDMEQPA